MNAVTQLDIYHVSVDNMLSWLDGNASRSIDFMLWHVTEYGGMTFLREPRERENLKKS